MKKKIAPLIWTFILTALSGLGFGLSLSASVMLCLRKFETLYAIASFCGLIAGIIFGLLAIVALIRYKTLLDRYAVMSASFLSAHKRLLPKAVFLSHVSKENLSIAAIDYVIITNISPEEKARLAPRLNEIPLQRIEAAYGASDCYLSFLPPSTLLFAPRKGDAKANAEEIAKQTLSTIGLDPTLPALKLLIGVGDKKEGNADVRLANALLASSYDSLSRLSGEVLVYDKAMEVGATGEKYDIDAAIKEERLEIAFVPLLNKRNKTAAYLADVSLFDPNRGLIERRELFREGDNLGYASKIDSYAVFHALTELHAWDEELRHKLGLLVLPCTRTALYEANFLFHVKKAALELEIDLKRLCIGIPGSILENDEAYAASLAKKIHALGMKLAIVDFSPRCSILRINEIRPDLVSFSADFAKIDPRLRDAEVAMLHETAELLETASLKGTYIPDLYPQKKVTSSVALEALRLEEEFRL